MKTKVMKSLLLAAAAILLVVATVLSTMAYMTSSSAVSNVFTVGNVTIDMKETKVNPDGTAVTPKELTDTNSYHLLPGKSYLKDPKITVSANCDSSYLFIRVRNDLKTIEKGHETPVDGAPTILEQLAANGWHEIERASNEVDAVFVYVGNSVPDGTAQATLNAVTVGGTKEAEVYDVFESFTLANEIPNLNAFGGARVAIVAYAIQADLATGYDIGAPESYTAAWDYIKAELPFVV